jgi:hypothetical protein
MKEKNKEKLEEIAVIVGPIGLLAITTPPLAIGLAAALGTAEIYIYSGEIAHKFKELEQKIKDVI